jgi:hypothetical protein
LVKILEKRQLAAGLAHLSWHDFRRTYISDLINQYDLVTAQKIIGHSSTSITAKYDRTWQEKAREAARMRVISLSARSANKKRPQEALGAITLKNLGETTHKNPQKSCCAVYFDHAHHSPTPLATSRHGTEVISYIEYKFQFLIIVFI